MGRLFSWMIAILFLFGVMIYESLPWSEDEMPKAYESNREAFELVAEFMADYDLSPYWTDEERQQNGCCISSFSDGKLHTAYAPAPKETMEQPSDEVHAAAMQLLDRAKIISIIKLAATPDFVYFRKHLERPLHDRERDMVYNSKGLAYTADVDKKPTCRGFGLRVGILEPIDEHWYYWYADEFD